MKFGDLKSNEIEIDLEPGETLHFGAAFLRSPVFSQSTVPPFWTGLLPDAFLGRLFAGKLWDVYVTATDVPEKVQLGGNEPKGSFLAVTVEPGQELFLRLGPLAAYSFGPGGGFRSSLGLLNPSRWILKAVSAVTVRGPATLLFYDVGAKAGVIEAGGHSFADQLLAFDAKAPFRLHGLLPEGSDPVAHGTNITSTTVNIEFTAPATVVKKTTRLPGTNRLTSLWRLLFIGLLGGWLVEKIVTHPWQITASQPQSVFTGKVSNCTFPLGDFQPKHLTETDSLKATVARRATSVGLERLALVQGTRTMWLFPGLNNGRLDDDPDGNLVELLSAAYSAIAADPGFEEVASAIPWCLAGVGADKGNGLVFVPASQMNGDGREDKAPTVVLLHGYGGSLLWNLWALKASFPDHVILLPSAGIEWADQDAAAVHRYIVGMIGQVESEHAIALDKPWLFSLSEGGATGFRLASAFPEDFKGHVAIATSADEPGALSVNGAFPILMVSGEKDESVPPEDVLDTFVSLKARGADIRRETLEEANHFFYLNERARLQRIIRDYMEEQARIAIIRQKEVQRALDIAARPSPEVRAIVVKPQAVEEQTAAIVRALDEFWRSAKAKEVHDRFMEDAATVAGTVALDGKYSSLDAFWAEYKSLVDDGKINEMAEVYIKQLFEALKPTVNELADEYKEPMDEALNQAFVLAQKNLASGFDESLRDRFPIWPRCFTTLPMPVIETPKTDAPGETAVGRRPVAKIGLALVIAPIIARIVAQMVAKVVTRASGKVVTKVTTKIAGKVAGKLIPFVGWALLAFDVVDAATARSRFEDAIRKEVLIALGEETKPESIWQSGGDDGPSARSEAEISIRRQLESYASQMQSFANSFLEVAPVVDAPAFAKLVTSLEEHGNDEDPDPVDIGRLVNRCKALSEAFGPLCATVDDFDMLEEMLLTAPDKRSLRTLSDLLGAKIIPLYELHRGALIEAAATLGPRNLADMIAQDRDWRFIAGEFRRLLGPSPTEAQRQGLLLVLAHQFDVKKFSNPELLGRIAKRGELFELLASKSVEPSRTFDLVMSDSAASFLEAIRVSNEALVAPLARDLSVTRLRHMGDEDRAKSIVAMWTVVRDSGIEPAAFTNEIAESDDLFTAHRDHGKDGVAIWLAHAGAAPGAAQRQRANQALSLHADGCPIDVCLDGANLTLTSWFYSCPVVGPTVHSWLYPLLARAPWLGWLLFIGVMAFMAATVWRFIRMVRRPGSGRSAGSLGRSRSASSRPVVLDHVPPSSTRSLPSASRNLDDTGRGTDT
jgi:pimeloyl-ACP methyl ester carboxylesterase